eukprot:1902734-Amphidinium_carterae.1
MASLDPGVADRRKHIGPDEVLLAKAQESQSVQFTSKRRLLRRPPLRSTSVVSEAWEGGRAVSGWARLNFDSGCGQNVLPDSGPRVLCHWCRRQQQAQAQDSERG